MDFGKIRLIIRRKLENGRLPLEKATRVLGRSATGEACDGCEMTIETGQLAMDGFVRRPGRKAMQLHLRCFEIWTQERYSLLREREESATRRWSLDGQPA
jgi:hypothetical protein